MFGFNKTAELLKEKSWEIDMLQSRVKELQAIVEELKNPKKVLLFLISMPYLFFLLKGLQETK
jgi:hypothetical protein